MSDVPEWAKNAIRPARHGEEPRVKGPPMTMDQVAWAMANREATLRLCDRLDGEETLMGFTRILWPVLEPGRRFAEGWGLEAVYDHLEGVTKGHIKKLLINVPPGFMKSMGTNVFWPAWEWGPKRKPWLRYITASYSEGLTYRDNDKCRTLLKSGAYQRLWGPQQSPCAWFEDRTKECDCGAMWHMRPDRDAISMFENHRTGWKLATSVGGTGTGARGDRFIIDDPHSVYTAESEAIRENTLRWATEVVSTRKNDPDSVFVLIMQRVHERDVAGLFMEAELGFTHLCIPMHYEADHPHRWVGGNGSCFKEVTIPGDDGDPETGREPRPPEKIRKHHCKQYGKGDPRTREGELAWEERFPPEEVEDIEKAMSAWGGTYAVSGQMQQRPTPRGGGMFQESDFQYLHLEAAMKMLGRDVRGWDLAGSKDKVSPYTVGVRMRRTYGGKLIIFDVCRERATPGEVEDMLLNAAKMDGYSVTQDFPQDPGQAGLHQVMAFGRLLEGFTFSHTLESGSKEDRARPFASQCENKNVWLVRAPWNDAYVKELCSFPKGQYKDQVDATSRAYDALLRDPDDTVFGAPTVYDGQ